MKPSNNSLMPKEDGGGNGMPETKNESIKNECENTIPKYVRNCPKCNKVLTYGTIGNLNLAIRKKCLCRSCTFSGKSPSQDTRIKMSLSHIGRKHTEHHKRKFSGSGNPMYGIHRYNNLNPFYGKHHNEDSKKKMRIAACKRILELQRSRDGKLNNIGKSESQYFDNLEQECKWNGIRQYFIEDLGYFVDYFEPTHNIVVEYDEPRHYRNGILSPKDQSRMEEIKAHIGCKFLRYNERENKIIEYV